MKCFIHVILLASIFTAHNGSAVTMDDVRNMPANSWLEVPNTHMHDVTLPEAYLFDHNIHGVQGPKSIMKSWGSGIYDTKRNRLLVWGGGHKDYHGNELYAFELQTMSWKRLTEPTEHPNLCKDMNHDGNPNARHTYGGITYIAHADRFFSCGGAVSCGAAGQTASTWTFDFNSSQWYHMKPTGNIPISNGEDCSVYDPATGRVFFGLSHSRNNPGLYSYLIDSNTWTRHTLDRHRDLVKCGMALDTRRNVVYTVKNGETARYDLNSPSISRQLLATTGSYSVDKCFEYDPVADRLVGFSGSTVHALNPETRVWTTHNPPGGPHYPSNYPRNGTYGRWRYVPDVNAFIVVMTTTSNVFFFKLTEGTGMTGVKSETVKIGSLLRAYPNPFSSRTVVSAPGAEAMAVYAVNGRLVYKTEKSEFILNAQSFRPGIYFVKARTGRRIVSAKLILK